ncbi:GNAT family N-acetyltransferase [Kitasatospora sp. NPDC056138]|uniref:GNAT family N-acetyltransferase n=1 Tax=Kitasatospora sp. NPDC056138 TaxID=3345724 RepID=UPI0035D5DA90
MKIRTGGPDDTADILNLLDGAVAWLVSLGRTGQWGDQPWSSRPAAVDRVHAYTGDADTFLVRLAEDADGTVVGCCVVSEQANNYATEIDERELYVRNLVTDRSRKGSGIGAALIADALAEARRRGIGLVRVDCYADGDRRLVGQYLELGFTPTETFEVEQPSGLWRGQILEIRV